MRHDSTLGSYLRPDGSRFFAARCSCGWASRHHDYVDDAIVEADRHRRENPATSGKPAHGSLDNVGARSHLAAPSQPQEG